MNLYDYYASPNELIGYDDITRSVGWKIDVVERRIEEFFSFELCIYSLFAESRYKVIVDGLLELSTINDPRAHTYVSDKITHWLMNELEACEETYEPETFYLRKMIDKLRTNMRKAAEQ